VKLLVNCIFEEFRCILRCFIYEVRLEENLRDEKGKRLAGRLSAGRRIIYIDNDQCEHEKIKTLIHELAHFLFGSAPEKLIIKIEELLWRRFSRKQKRSLEKWLPKQIFNSKKK